jgi:hypothetical protein
MCFLLTIVFVVATVAFFSHGLILQGSVSAVVAAVSLFFLIRKLFLNGRCIFGKDRDCGPK